MAQKRAVCAPWLALQRKWLQDGALRLLRAAALCA